MAVGACLVFPDFAKQEVHQGRPIYWFLDFIQLENCCQLKIDKGEKIDPVRQDILVQNIDILRILEMFLSSAPDPWHAWKARLLRMFG